MRAKNEDSLVCFVGVVSRAVGQPIKTRHEQEVPVFGACQLSADLGRFLLLQSRSRCAASRLRIALKLSVVDRIRGRDANPSAIMTHWFALPVVPRRPR